MQDHVAIAVPLCITGCSATTIETRSLQHAVIWGRSRPTRSVMLRIGLDLTCIHSPLSRRESGQVKDLVGSSCDLARMSKPSGKGVTSAGWRLQRMSSVTSSLVRDTPAPCWHYITTKSTLRHRHISAASHGCWVRSDRHLQSFFAIFGFIRIRNYDPLLATDSWKWDLRTDDEKVTIQLV